MSDTGAGDVLRHKVEEALKDVIDPETRLNVMRMNIIHDLTINTNGDAGLVFRPSSPICPMAFHLANSIKEAVENVEGINSVSIRVNNFNQAERLEKLLNVSKNGETKIG